MVSDNGTQRGQSYLRGCGREDRSPERLQEEHRSSPASGLLMAVPVLTPLCLLRGQAAELELLLASSEAPSLLPFLLGCPVTATSGSKPAAE